MDIALLAFLLATALVGSGCRTTAIRHVSDPAPAIARLQAGGSLQAEVDGLVRPLVASGEVYGMVVGVVTPDGATHTFCYGRTGRPGDPQPPGADASNGVMALAIGESHVALQVTAGGGVAALRALRALQGALEAEGSQRVLHADLVAREGRITLGQLPAELRGTMRRIRVFGPRDLAQQLVDEMELRLDATGLKIESVARYAASEFGIQLPPDAPVSPAFSLAAGRLAGRRALFEFLLPKVTPLQQLAARYSSGRLRTVISAATAVALVAAGLFFFQQCQLWRLESQWAKIQPTVRQLEGVQDQIRQYRPWYDESVRGLTILKRLTEAFPEDGSVTAKTVEIRDLNTITCTGIARNYQALLKTVEKLRGVRQIPDVNLGPTRGQPPALQFTFNFQWSEGGKSAN